MSDNYLPEIVSPKPDTQSDGERDYGDEGGMSFHEGGDGVEDENIEVEIKEEPEIIPEEIPKRKLSNEEVFKTPKVKEIKPILQKEEENVEEKPVKKKRQMSEKQLQHLARIREKGQKALKEKRELDKKFKAEGKKPPPSKRSKKKVISDPKGQGENKDPPIQQSSLNKQDIEDITTNAIDRYEVKRKARKEEKKKKQATENHQKKVQTTIQKALGQEQDIWGNALKGLYGN
jgi:hypothetical protein